MTYLSEQLHSETPWDWDVVRVSQWLRELRIEPLAILPYPDWSRLQNRRLDEDGTEAIIPINLQEAIDACQDETAPVEARRWDHLLRRGDIVELPILAEAQRIEPWTGWAFETARLFQKALHREVIYQDLEGLFRKVTMRHVPSHYLSTNAGLLPVPTEMLEYGAVSVPRADYFMKSMVGGSTGEVMRGRSTFPLKLWLQDGDRVIATGVPRLHLDR